MHVHVWYLLKNLLLSLPIVASVLLSLQAFEPWTLPSPPLFNTGDQPGRRSRVILWLMDRKNIAFQHFTESRFVRLVVHAFILCSEDDFLFCSLLNKSRAEMARATIKQQQKRANRRSIYQEMCLEPIFEQFAVHPTIGRQPITCSRHLGSEFFWQTLLEVVLLHCSKPWWWFVSYCLWLQLERVSLQQFAVG